jgi:uncharacterized membrane protein (UPF0136 family)
MLHELTVLAADNVFGIANELIDNTESVLIALATVAAIALVIMTYLKTRAWAPTVAMIVMAAVVLWGVNNADVLESTTDQTLDDAGAPQGED